MSDKSYYSKKLSALKLQRCYEVASPRIQQYLQAEIDHVLELIQETAVVLELGCGYGRLLPQLAKKANAVFGIDLSKESIDYAKNWLASYDNIHLYVMDAKAVTFQNNSFDVVLAVQNAISAFKIPPKQLIIEAIRVLKPGGKLILTSYSENIWKARLEWFIKQSEEGLLGEIDFDKTKNGKIICKDGFTASTYSPGDFQNLVDELELSAEIYEIDDSSIFCVITK